MQRWEKFYQRLVALQTTFFLSLWISSTGCRSLKRVMRPFGYAQIAYVYFPYQRAGSVRCAADLGTVPPAAVADLSGRLRQLQQHPDSSEPETALPPTKCGYEDRTMVTLNTMVGWVQFVATHAPDAEIVEVPDRIPRTSHAE
jgi:hypothetical protein